MNHSIMVVDDDREFLKSVQRGLTISGFKNIRGYQDPLEAAQGIEKGEAFDVALIDITMPGMSGIDLLDIIKTKHPFTVCIILTAVDDTCVSDICLKKGAFDYLVKPISREDLVSSVRRALLEKSGSPPTQLVIP